MRSMSFTVRGFLAVTAAGLVLGVMPANAATAPIKDDQAAAYPSGNDLYQAMRDGQPFECQGANDTPCHITAKVKITKSERRYLGLSSRTLASGTAKGPKTMTLGGQRHTDVYTLAFPTSLAKRLKAKHVVSMWVYITDDATYQGYPPDSGDGSSSSSTATVTHESTWPNQGDTDRYLEGQGTRYGCRTVAHGDITLGYWHQGQSCP